MPSSAVRSRPRPPPRHRLRAGIAFAIVIALHGLAALWFTRHREPFAPPPPADVPVQIALLKPEPIERQPAPAPARPVKPAEPKPRAPAPARKPRPAAPNERVLSATQPAEHGAPPAVASAPAAASDGSGASGTGNAGPASGASGSTSGSTSGGTSGGTPAGPASHGVKFIPPPSGDLQYDSFFNGMRNSMGTIHWRTDGRTYDLSVSMPVPFIGPFRYRSEGRVDGFGIAPDRYVEQRGRRPEDIAIFNREIRQVVFTRTPNNAPLPDGTQDRFSMLMQLAGLVRGDPDRYKRGVTREFFVVDNNSGETWPITVIGDETVQTAAGFMTTRHFMRLPRRAGDTRRIDMWLAPSLDWLPARLVQTEPNGSQIELLWHGRIPVPDAGAGTDRASASSEQAPSDSVPAAPASAPAEPASAASGASAASATAPPPASVPASAPAPAPPDAAHSSTPRNTP